MTVSNGEFLEWGRRTYVMGIVNVTPDSFSGDGLDTDIEAIVDQAVRMVSDGADMIDIGAESTRPGSSPISDEEELARLIPALRAVRNQVRVPISVDTYKCHVALRALEEGADILNDVWGLKADPKMADVAAKYDVPIIIMHNQKTRKYRDLLPDMIDSLSRSISIAKCAGIAESQIILDPGIGFGKSADHNLEVLRRLSEFQLLGHPVLVGTSRKSTIGSILGLPLEQRVEGTAATVALSIAGEADIVRVHDVKEMVRVSRMSDAIVRGWRPPDWRR
ncbi:MAG: dihydropteroate synthase [Dehalococcoidia bacterium]|nr:dihydropteroate synthase [Dehalococcoidia bacterium]